jgi:hypothetical protein
MTALVVCWAALPLLLGGLAQGCGTLVERACGRALALGVRVPCGVALMIAAMDLATRSPSTARLAVPAVLALGVVGLALRPPWRWRGLDRGLLAGAIMFAVYAAPVVLSGMATWTGYIKLDDTATWLALVDRALTHGRTLAGLPPSTYRAVLSSYLTVGYPLGSFLPLGIGHTLLGQDIAWLVNPWMAFLAAVLALALHHIANLALGARPRSWAPVAIAALAAQPALLYGYYLWGGIKELAGAMLIAAFAVAAPLALTGARRARALIPVGVVLWGLIAALSPGGLVWVGPGLVLAAGSWALRGALRRTVPAQDRGEAGATTAQPPARAAEPPRPSGRPTRRARARLPPWPVSALVLAAVAAGAYLVLRPGGFVEHFEGVLTRSNELGNLVKPLSVEQVAGIWPVGDFRFAPGALTATHVLVAVVFVCAAGGLVLALWEGRRELALYVLCALAGAGVVYAVAAPWLAAKALASASPALPLAALTAAAALAARVSSGRRSSAAERIADPARGGAGGRAFAAWRRPSMALTGSAIGVAALVGCAIAGGIVWSNVAAYHDVNLAPREQFAELAAIGERIAGRGPTLMPEYQPYGARHFLREAAPESASELREREDPLISGELLEKGESADIDQIQLAAVLVYRTLVLQRSPVASRPPSPYRLTFRDRFWEVWQRPAKLERTIVWHLPLGDATHPGSIPNCATVMRLAQRRGVAQLIAAPAVNPEAIPLAAGSHPAAWSTGTAQLAPAGAGSAHLSVRVARGGRYSVWLEGSIRGPLSIYVDGRRVGEALNELQEPGQYIPFGELTLGTGVHTVELRYGGGEWHPGIGGPAEAIGPLMLRRVTPPQPLIALAPSRARSLCGRTLDWIEGVGA